MAEGAKLTTEVVDCGGFPLVRVSGQVDLHNVHEFEKAMRTGIEREAKALIVDLTGISYLDSAGLSALVAAYKMLESRGAGLYIVASSDQPGVWRVLDVSRLNTFIPVHNTVDEVLNDLRVREAA